jgi:hypothetical protein
VRHPNAPWILGMFLRLANSLFLERPRRQSTGGRSLR